MAINWTMKTAMDAILKNDKESLMDIGKRFPLAFKALVEAQTNAGAVAICNALEDLTVRKLESVLKDGVAEKTDSDVEDEAEAEEKPKATEKKSGRGRPSKKKEEPVEEPEPEDEEDPVALYKQCKKAGIDVKPRQSAKYYKDALAKANEADEEDADDWDDEEEEVKPKKKAEKPAKSKKKADPEPEDDDEDDDDWDI